MRSILKSVLCAIALLFCALIATYDVCLSSLNPTAIYRVFNKDNGETEEYTGQQLSNGLTLTLPQPRTSLLLKYEKK